MIRATRSALLLTSVAGCALLSAGPGGAQEWTVDLSAGQSVHAPLDATMGATGLALGVRREGPLRVVLSAGAPFDAAGMRWGAVGMARRLSTAGGQISAGLDIGADGFGFFDGLARQSGGGVALEGMPLIALRSGRVGLEMRSGLIHRRTLYSGALRGRTLHQTDAQAVFETERLVVAAESRFLRAAEGNYPFVGGAAEIRLDPLVLSAHGGSWMAESIETPIWGLGARIRIGSTTEAHLSFQQETNEPVYWTTPRRSWNAGFSHRIGRGPRRGAPAALTPGDGGITFRLPLALSPDPPSLAGEFSGWKELPMRRDRGFWTVTLPIRPGVYRYAFRRADSEWFVPEEFPGREGDGFGGFNAVLIVP